MNIVIGKLKQAIANIDPEDFNIVMNHWWSIDTSYYCENLRYAYTKVNKKQITMHRLILGLTDRKLIVDHIDGNGLNNRRSNLRICTVAQNLWNRGAQSNNRSGLKGVSRGPCISKPWIARIVMQKQRFHLGYFATPQEAHAAYCEAAKRLHGEFARTE